MRTLTACPSCGGDSLAPYSLTPVEERNGAMHFAQTRCRSCDLVFTNPVCDATELERFYQGEYYEDHESEFNAHDPRLEQLIRDRAVGEAHGLKSSVLPYVARGTFFEIGAGYGALLEGARSLGFSVAGVEPSARAAAFGQQVLGLSGLRHGMFDPRDWPERAFDVIYSFQVIEHVPDLHAFAGGVARMLKPGGLAVIGTENHHNIWTVIRRVRSWMKRRRLPEFQTATHHTFYFCHHSLRALVERHGLQVQHAKVYTPPLAHKLARSHFRHWYSRVAFYLMHFADVFTGRGGRVLVWCRKPL
jgi:2-polyprenyl-3-methyl-5-hydroxy-6-metoxy-1,4-benzoquinol methylase